jgi:large subunit ribosomal protein L21
VDVGKAKENRKMKYAILQSGGKQYRAEEGQVIEVDRLAADEGSTVELEEVLLIVDGDKTQVGAPLVSGAHVKANVVEHIRGPKVLVFKYKAKMRYRVRQGHRQDYTRLRIERIAAGGRAAAKKASAG